MLLPQCTLILDGAGLDTAEAHTDGGHRKVHAGVHLTTGMYHVKLVCSHLRESTSTKVKYKLFT
jgi:hypothetical protein